MILHADLHLHSTASDGSGTPARVVERAAALGLKVIALTDHDTLDGLPEARAAGERLGVRVVAGTELTCYRDNKEINILGYGVDPASPALRAHCEAFVAARQARAREIGQKLAALGVPVDMEAVVASTDGGVVGRPHVAKALVAAGHAKDPQEAFDKYLGNGKPADVPKMVVDSQFIIDVIHAAGGIAVLAHPGLWNQFDLVPILKEMGLDGVEVWHSIHTGADRERLHALADAHGLVKTGGSDCHGSGGTRTGTELMGTCGLDEEHWLKVEAAMEGR